MGGLAVVMLLLLLLLLLMLGVGCDEKGKDAQSEEGRDDSLAGSWSSTHDDDD